jgi:hypothetical protein
MLYSLWTETPDQRQPPCCTACEQKHLIRDSHHVIQSVNRNTWSETAIMLYSLWTETPDQRQPPCCTACEQKQLIRDSHHVVQPVNRNCRSESVPHSAGTLKWRFELGTSISCELPLAPWHTSEADLGRLLSFHFLFFQDSWSARSSVVHTRRGMTGQLKYRRCVSNPGHMWQRAAPEDSVGGSRNLLQCSCSASSLHTHRDSGLQTSHLASIIIEHYEKWIVWVRHDSCTQRYFLTSPFYELGSRTLVKTIISLQQPYFLLSATNGFSQQDSSKRSAQWPTCNSDYSGRCGKRFFVLATVAAPGRAHWN